jgi:hypothetical protein
MEPNLTIERELGPRASEGIEFYYSTDGFLEIHAWNGDSDSFIIILNPDEVLELRRLIEIKVI